MKKYIGLLVFISIAAYSFAQEEPGLFVQDSLKLISSDFKFTEGASVDKRGNVFFTDQPNDKIWKYDTKGNLTVFMEKSGRANGTYFDRNGNLVVCADENNEIWSIDKNKNVMVLFSDLHGKKVNGPNDVWIDKKGGIYFTDPYYQRDYWTRTRPEIEGENVYYLPKGETKPILVADDLIRPNGIVGTPDNKYLYVSDRKGDQTYKYSIQPDGTLKNQQLIINQGSDGMTLDNKGNIYISGKGVTVFKATGEKIGHIDVPENWVGNICFGGRKKNILFVAASKSLYSIETTVKGVE